MRKSKKQEVVRQLLPQLTSHKLMLPDVTADLFYQKDYPYSVNSNAFDLLEQCIGLKFKRKKCPPFGFIMHEL